MEEAAHHQPQHDAEQGEEDVFPVDVGGDLPVEEAQHLQGGQLPDALGDIDVGQVVEHHEGQGRGGGDDDNHGVVDGLHTVGEVVPKRGDIGVGIHSVQGHQVGGHGIRLRFPRPVGVAQQHLVQLGVLAEQRPIAAVGQVDVVGDIVFRDVVHPGLHPFAVVVQSDGITHRNLQQLGQLFRDDHAIVRQDHRRVVGAVAQLDELLKPLLVVHREQVDVLGRAGGGRLQGGGAGEQVILYPGARVQVAFHLGQLVRPRVLVQAQGGVVEEHVVELLV